MNIKSITDNLLCSGCGTCNTICGHQAIKMKKTPTMGLLYAEIDADKCMDCGLCINMCPSAHVLEEKRNVTSQKIIGDIKACYVGRSLNKEIFAIAQSGGMVTAILTYLFNNNFIDAAVSCRMEYGSPTPSVHYSILTNSEDLHKNQKSCYTQVDIVSALKETSQYKSVAVVGVPCHIQGVSNLMTFKKYSNISYKIGLVCDETYTDAYMDAIMSEIQRPQGDVRINYKQKNFTHNGKYYSYQMAPTVIANEKGDMAIVQNTKRMFLKDYFAVPKCKICWDKLNSRADIVLGDPWGLKGMYDEKEGDSIILVRNLRALNIISEMTKDNLITTSNVEIHDVAAGQNINKRCTDIINFDFKNKVRTWRNIEMRTRVDVVKDVSYMYKTSKVIVRIKTLFSKLRRFPSKLAI